MKKMHVVIILACMLSGCRTDAPPETPTVTQTDEPTNLTVTASPTSAISALGIEGERLSVVDECLRSVPQLRDYLASFPIPDELMGEEPIAVPIPGGVDPMHFFTILDELSIEPGYRLDYVLFSDWLGGKPLVYAHPISQAAYSTYADFAEAVGGSADDDRSYGYLDYGMEYLLHIQIDSFPEGAFQYATLVMMGDQFYLYWHALYHDELIMCDVQDIDLVMEAIEGFATEIPEEVLSQAEALNFEPYLIIDDDQVLVRFVFFTKWGGFVEARYLFSTRFPHELLNAEFNVLVEYECGIMF